MSPLSGNIVTLLLVLLQLYLQPTSGQCIWQYNRTSASCQLRLIERNGLDMQGADGTTTLDIKCSELLLFESQLPVIAFQRLHSLSELQITSCKLLQLSDGAFNGLNMLKKLVIRTKNSDWGPGKSLELQGLALEGLNALQTLDLSENNLRSLPDNVLCPINSLQVLNLTQNRIRSAISLGFANKTCQSGGELQVLDVSFNELRSIPESWGVSRLRRLQQLYLQNNNISELSVDSFSGLNSLRVLNLSHNHLETVPENLFDNSKDLREIHLQDNELYELPRGIFHRLEQLLVLDLSGNQLSSHHIDNTTFSGLIRLIILNLAHNALTRIDSRTFNDLFFLQILDLRNNSIGHIEENAFLPLYNLHTLNLAENRLHTLDDKLFNGLYVLSKLTLNNNLVTIVELNAFKNCSDLKELDLSANQLAEVPEALQDLTVLRTLDLGENQLTGFKNGSFKNLHQLTGLRLIDNQIGNISRGMFDGLPRLSVLNLAKNRIQSIERGAFDKNVEIEALRLDKNFLSDINGVFASLNSLLWLNLAENHMVWFDYAFIPTNLKWLDVHGNYIESLGNYYKLQEEIRVKTLDASHNRITEINPMSIPNSIELLFINNNYISVIHPNTFVDKTNLTRVDLYANALTKVQLHTFRLAPVAADKPLPEFYLGGNPYECDCSMEWLQRINNLTTRQHPRVMDLQNVECVMPHTRGSTVRPLNTLKSNDFLCRYETHCFALCHCCDFDACDCEMTCPQNCTCYHDQTWNTNVVDCGKQNALEQPKRLPMDATDVYLDGNNIVDLKNNAFIGRKNLMALFLNASNIVSIQNRTFSGLTSLRILHLEDNQLHTLQGYEFEHLFGLQELYLQNNKLTNIANSTFASLGSLAVFRIDGNRLTSFPYWAQVQHTKQLSLGRNLWSCRCKMLQELTVFVSENALIIQDSQDIFCVDGAIKRELDLNATTVCSDFYSEGSVLPIGLPKMYIPVLVSVLTLLFLLVLVIILFMFREPLRVWLFAHYGVRVFSPRCEETEKLYDAVLLHSPKDIEFVQHEIAAELELGRPPLRVCIQNRDIAHEATHLQLLEAARASRRVVLILSRNFLQTEWSRCEFRRAVHDAIRGRPDKLVIIEEPDIAYEAESDIELVPYLKTTTVYRIRRSDRHFREKLRYSMPADMAYHGNNYTLEQHHHPTGHVKQPSSPGVLYRQAPPPSYYQDADETNYSSATTATPSPRFAKRNIAQQQQQQQQQQQHHQQLQQQNQVCRPPSEHIYSSIDSDYADAVENASGQYNAGINLPLWRQPTAGQQQLSHQQHQLQLHEQQIPQQQQQLQPNQNADPHHNMQSYLV